MIIKLKEKNIKLSEWIPIKQSYIDGHNQFNWKREDLNAVNTATRPNSCCIHTSHDYHAVYFSGSLIEFDNIYMKIFGTRNLYMSVDLSKIRIDKFLNNYIKLLAFL